MLAAGLWSTLRTYRQSGFLARLSPVDWIMWLVVSVYLGREISDVVVALRAGVHFSPGQVLVWPVDPLLWLLLAEALVLYRSVQQMGQGWIGRCWRAFSIGVFLVALGDILFWATNWGYLPWPWSSVGWYVWIPAAAAFALAPAYQLEAMWSARSR